MKPAVKRPTRLAIAICFATAMTLQLLLIFVELPIFLEFSSGLLNPDQLFGYTHESIASLFERLGTMGLAQYRSMLLLDNVYTLANASWIAMFILRYYPWKAWRVLAVVPAIAVAADLMENIILLTTIGTWPTISNELVSLSSFATQLKILSMPVAAVALLGSIFGAIRSLRTGRWFYWSGEAKIDVEL